MFFALSMPAKEQISMYQTQNESAHRGYFSFGQEGADASSLSDVKEGIHIGKEDGKNRWPESVAEPLEWRNTMLRYVDEMYRIGNSLLTAFALDLGLDEAFFLPMFDPGMGLLRIVHYPPQDITSEGFDSRHIGCGKHTDFGIVTILSQDSPGLQVLNKADEWISVPPLPDHFVVNLGDCMERWTNGLYKATPHRVINQGTLDRYAIPFFFEPNADTLLSPLPIRPRDHSDESSTTSTTTLFHEPLCFGAYLKTRLAEIWQPTVQDTPN
eukprot:TRINITY_DN3526_c0_g1_i2.p1 TRINITY_DN3526_c0_g1~~TRINITY_DN3526_c0_g1_i2.p1  ORF type:complete len:269 (+),score=22.92 TRINITY_DN3526_c0_g1_i2:289-1095(+)